MKTLCLFCVRAALFAAFGLAAGSAAHAQNANITFSLTPNQITATAGSTVTFYGKVANTGSSAIYLVGDTFSQVSSVLTPDDTTSDYFNNTPYLLNGGASYPASGTASFFTVMVAAGTAAGTYSGQFNIQGGPTDQSQNALATQTFSVVVAAAPEPSQAACLAVGVLGLATLGLKARRRTVPAAA